MRFNILLRAMLETDGHICTEEQIILPGEFAANGIVFMEPFVVHAIINEVNGKNVDLELIYAKPYSVAYNGKRLFLSVGENEITYTFTEKLGNGMLANLHITVLLCEEHRCT